MSYFDGTVVQVAVRLEDGSILCSTNENDTCIFFDGETQHHCSRGANFVRTSRYFPGTSAKNLCIYAHETKSAVLDKAVVRLHNNWKMLKDLSLDELKAVDYSNTHSIIANLARERITLMEQE